MVVVVQPAWGRWWLFSGLLLGSAALPLAPQGGHLFPPSEDVSPLLLCMLKTLPWLPMCCGKLSALGDVSVHLCSLIVQDASPTY